MSTSKPNYILTERVGANSLTFLAAIIDTIADPIFVKDRQHRWVLLNRAFQDMLGHSREEMLGKSDYEFFPKDQADIFWAKDEEVFESNTPIENIEYLTDAQGVVHTISTKKSAFKTVEGEIFLVGNIRNITEIKRTEAELRATREQLEQSLQILHHAETLAGVGGWELEIESQKFYWTEQIAFIHEWPTCNAPTLADILAFYPAEHRDEVKNIFERALRAPTPYDIEIPMHTAKGKEIWVRALGGPVYSPSGQLFKLAGAFQDISARKRVDAKIAQHIKELEAAHARIDAQAKELRLQAEELAIERDTARQASNVKGEFLANMSHEIRTPINGVLGMTDLLLESPLTQAQQEWATLAKMSGEHLLTLINDILDFSKIEAGKLELHIVSFNPRQLIGDIERLTRLTIDAKQINFKIEIADEIPRHLLGDPVRLTQVLTNLIGNAIKFTPSGGTVIVELTLISSDSTSCDIQFAVIDNGIGIPIEKQENIFEAFTQADASTTRRFGGTGLGLSISSKLTRLMGGTIKLVSQQDHGSSFSFTVNFKIDTLTAITPACSIHRSTQTPRIPTGLRVLIVEDNHVNQFLSSEILQRAGGVVTVASTGAEAIELFSKQPFDLILMDIQMAILGGEEATTIIQSLPNGKTTPIIALTANCMAGDRERYLSIGMSGYVSKPFKQADLLAEINKALAKKL